MENYQFKIYYYNNNTYSEYYAKATGKEKVASHYDHLKRLFNCNCFKIYNLRTNEEFKFNAKELAKNRLLNLSELIFYKRYELL